MTNQHAELDGPTERFLIEASRQTLSQAMTGTEIAREFEGWVPWRGGACPVHPSTMVIVRCVFERDYDEAQMPRRAGCWDWQHRGNLEDITAYKVVV